MPATTNAVYPNIMKEIGQNCRQYPHWTACTVQ